MDLIKKLTTQESDGTSDLHDTLQEGIQNNEIKVKSTENGSKIYVSITPCGEFRAEMEETFKIVKKTFETQLFNCLLPYPKYF